MYNVINSPVDTGRYNNSYGANLQIKNEFPVINDKEFDTQ